MSWELSRVVQEDFIPNGGCQKVVLDNYRQNPSPKRVVLDNYNGNDKKGVFEKKLPGELSVYAKHEVRVVKKVVLGVVGQSGRNRGTWLI